MDKINTNTFDISDSYIQSKVKEGVREQAEAKENIIKERLEYFGISLDEDKCELTSSNSTQMSAPNAYTPAGDKYMIDGKEIIVLILSPTYKIAILEFETFPTESNTESTERCTKYTMTLVYYILEIQFTNEADLRTKLRVFHANLEKVERIKEKERQDYVEKHSGEPTADSKQMDYINRTFV